MEVNFLDTRHGRGYSIHIRLYYSVNLLKQSHIILLNRESKNYSIHYLFPVCSTISIESFLQFLFYLPVLVNSGQAKKTLGLANAPQEHPF